MPKCPITRVWYCDVCAEFAEYHLGCGDHQEWYCTKHWNKGKPDKSKRKFKTVKDLRDYEQGIKI